MTDTVISDGLRYPQDEGIGSIQDGNETWSSAGYLGALGGAAGYNGFVEQGLSFANHDGANDQFDLTAGRAFVQVSSVDVQTALGGTQVPAYQQTMGSPVLVMLELPTGATDLSATDSSLNDVWIAYAIDGSVTGVSAGDVYIRHGTGLSAPPHPSIKIGQVNPDDSSQDTRANDGTPTGFLAADNVTISTDSFLTGGGTVSLGGSLNVGLDDTARLRQVAIPLTEIQDGNTAIGLQKLIPSGKTIRVVEAGVTDDAENTPSGLTIEVRDVTNAADVFSQSTKHAEGTPLASKSGAIDVQFRVNNGTGSTVNASGYVLYTME